MEVKSKKMKFKTGILVMAIGLLMMAMVMSELSAQGQDDNAKPAKELNAKDKDNMDWAVYDYVSITGVSADEAKRRLQLQDIARELNAELSMNEAETLAGLWIEHSPEFKIVVQFTRDGEETIKPYIKQHPELANVVEMRTAKVSLVDLQKARASASSSVHALGISVASETNVAGNSVNLYMAKADRSQFDNALQRGKIQLPDKVKVITVEAMDEEKLEVDIYGGLALTPCTSGFSVKKGWWPFITKGITTAGHCSNTVTYNGNNLPLNGEKWTGSYDTQWHTAPGYTVTNKIQYKSDGSTRPIYATKSRNNQQIGEYVCKYGKTTGYTCGRINTKDYKPDPANVPNPAATFIRVDNTAGWNDLSDAGDSGGPWFWGTTAYGTHSGSPRGDSNDAWYTAVNYVESGLGVTVMTS